jgi:hypothetical protein
MRGVGNRVGNAGTRCLGAREGARQRRLTRRGSASGSARAAQGGPLAKVTVEAPLRTLQTMVRRAAHARDGLALGRRDGYKPQRRGRRGGAASAIVRKRKGGGSWGQRAAAVGGARSSGGRRAQRAQEGETKDGPKRTGSQRTLARPARGQKE